MSVMISQEEYLRTSFEGPEPDYVEGRLIQRPAPNTFHARTKVRLFDIFKSAEHGGQLFRLPASALLRNDSASPTLRSSLRTQPKRSLRTCLTPS